MAIRRIADAKSKYAHRCLTCGRGSLGRLKDGKAVRCKECGTVHLVKLTMSGNVILTDKKYKKYFDEKKAGGSDNE